MHSNIYYQKNQVLKGNKCIKNVIIRKTVFSSSSF